MADDNKKAKDKDNTLANGQKKCVKLVPDTKKHKIKCKATEGIDVIELTYIAIQDHPLPDGMVIAPLDKNPCKAHKMMDVMKSKKIWGIPKLVIPKHHWCFIIKLANGKQIIYDKGGDFKEIGEFKIYNSVEIKKMGTDTPFEKLKKHYGEKYPGKSTKKIKHGMYTPECYKINKQVNSFDQHHLNELAKILIENNKANLEVQSPIYKTKIKYLLPAIKLPKAIHTGNENKATVKKIFPKRTYNSISNYIFPIQLASNAQVKLKSGEVVPVIITPGILEDFFKKDKSKSLYYSSKDLSSKAKYKNASEIELEFADVRLNATDKQVLAEKDVRKKNFDKFLKIATYQPEFDDNRFNLAIEWLEKLEVYAYSDFGSRIIKCVLEHYKELLEKKYLHNDCLTIYEDKSFDFGPYADCRFFKIISPQSATKKGGKKDAPGVLVSTPTGVGGSTLFGPKIKSIDKNKITYSKSELSKSTDTDVNTYPLQYVQTLALSDMPVRVLFGKNSEIFHLAILHHEFSHTMFGLRNSDNELEPTDEWENPVRLMYGILPRLAYVKIDIKLDHPFRLVPRTCKGIKDEDKNRKIYKHDGCSKYVDQSLCAADINAALPTVTPDEWTQLKKENELLLARTKSAVTQCKLNLSEDICKSKEIKWKDVYYKAYEDGKSHKKRMLELERAINAK